jgi:hypothetical protein
MLIIASRSQHRSDQLGLKLTGKLRASPSMVLV